MSTMFFAANASSVGTPSSASPTSQQGRKLERAAEMPDFLRVVIEKAQNLHQSGEPFNQCIVTHYPPNSGIGWHTDTSPRFGECVVGVSLGGEACASSSARTAARRSATRSRRLQATVLDARAGRVGTTSIKWCRSRPSGIRLPSGMWPRNEGRPGKEKASGVENKLAVFDPRLLTRPPRPHGAIPSIADFCVCLYHCRESIRRLNRITLGHLISWRVQKHASMSSVVQASVLMRHCVRPLPSVAGRSFWVW